MSRMIRETTHMRVYKEDVKEIQIKFPKVRMADFFHMAVKTNPFLQAEAMLRGKNVRRKKR